MSQSESEEHSSYHYKKALNASLKSVYFYFIITGAVNFLFSSRQTVWVEYASTFNHSSARSISLILFCDAILSGFVGIGFSTLGDYIGFDKSITYKLSLITIGCILEAIANNFTVLCIGFLLSQTAMSYVAQAYIAWILPLPHAKKQASLLISFFTSCYLLGPLFSGVSFKLTSNYRFIFIINAVLMSIVLLFSVLFVYGSQKQLEQIQIAACSQMMEIEHNHLLSESEQENLHEKIKTNNTNNDTMFPSFIEGIKSRNSDSRIRNICREISCYVWFGVIMTIMQASFLLSIESVVVSYYVPYIHVKYNDYFTNENNLVLLATLQIMAVTVSFIITAFIMSKLSDTCLPMLHKKINANVTIILLCLIQIIVHGLLIFYGEYVAFHMYWLYAVMVGVSFGYVNVVIEFLFLEVQPPQYAGLITGIKCLARNTIKAAYFLFIGFYWDVTGNSMLWSITFGCTVVLLLSGTSCYFRKRL